MSEPGPRKLDDLLSDVYNEFIAIRDEDFELHYTVLQDLVFDQLRRAMMEVDRYYEKYHGEIHIGGSHFDTLRVERPDEFDVNMVINLPISMEVNRADPDNSDIRFRMGNRKSAYMELLMGPQFQNLPNRDDWETNQTAYRWMDSKTYLSRAKFYSWFQKVVDKALNKFRDHPKAEAVFNVDGTDYTVKRKNSGPAVTMIIENVNNEFCLHVDLVPALRFSQNRWPIGEGYRVLPKGCESDSWLVVPKPDKQWQGGVRWTSISWRASLHFQEKRLIHDTQNLRQALRLIKKLRNASDMHGICSYFIKTLFLWKVVDPNVDSDFWNNSPGYIFKEMVKDLYEAVCRRKIRYFWNKRCNLLDNIERKDLEKYAVELKDLLEVLNDPARYEEVADFILTEEQLNEYRELED